MALLQPVDLRLSAHGMEVGYHFPSWIYAKLALTFVLLVRSLSHTGKRSVMSMKHCALLPGFRSQLGGERTNRIPRSVRSQE